MRWTQWPTSAVGSGRYGELRPLVIGFQFAPLLANLASLLLGAFPTLGFPRQRFGQPLELLLHLDLRRVQFLGPCFQPGLFGARVLLLCLQLFLRLLQLLP